MTIAELARAVAGEVTGDSALKITRVVHPLDATGPEHLAVAMDKKYARDLATTKATAAVVAMDTKVPANITTVIRVPWAKRALVELTNSFATPWHRYSGIHASATIDPTAVIGKNVNIGPACVVGPRSVIGDGVTLQAQMYVGADVTLGPNGFYFAGVRIMDGVQIGARAIIHANAVIGADGFSFVNAEKGSVEAFKEGRASSAVGDAVNNHLLRIASVGGVVIGDDVEIGAGTCIDRATLRTTRIGNGTKIDNQVQIGHNAEIGQNVMICGQAGVAGSTVVGDRVVIGASAGIADNLKIGNDAMVGAASGVGGSVPEKTIVMGSPAMPAERAHQVMMAWMRLPQMAQQIELIKAQLKALEDDTKTA
jgi:UDP-3-O-[3-hydroxymyristoyl] glucosamine N-acyltransferase